MHSNINSVADCYHTFLAPITHGCNCGIKSEHVTYTGTASETDRCLFLDAEVGWVDTFRSWKCSNLVTEILRNVPPSNTLWAKCNLKVCVSVLPALVQMFFQSLRDCHIFWRYFLSACHVLSAVASSLWINSVTREHLEKLENKKKTWLFICSFRYFMLNCRDKATVIPCPSYLGTLLRYDYCIQWWNNCCEQFDLTFTFWYSAKSTFKSWQHILGTCRTGFPYDEQAHTVRCGISNNKVYPHRY